MRTAIRNNSGVGLVTIQRSHYEVCAERVRPLLSYWGRNLDSLSLEQLAVACYSQGFCDGIQVAEKYPQLIQKEEPIDFQI